MTKKLLSVLILVCMILIFVCTVSAENIQIHPDAKEVPAPQITAQAALVLNLDTGSILYAKNASDQIYPASTVKIMTAIIVLEAINDPETLITASVSAVNNVTGNKIGILNGEVFRAEDLMYALMIAGANDAANVLAEYIGGTISNFIDMMNAKAKELGCSETIYTNVTGLHMPTMLSSAGDVAKIAQYAYTIDRYLDITSSPSWTISATNKYSERYMYNRNHFVSKAYLSQYMYPSSRGMNAGSTAEAGYALVTTASQKEMNYLCVIMGATEIQVVGAAAPRVNSFIDAKALLDWAFTLYTKKTIATTKDFICEEKVKLAANNDTIKLSPANDIEAVLPSTVDVKTDIERSVQIDKEQLIAPVIKGQELGEVYYIYNGNIIGQAKLVSDSEIERSNLLYNIEQIKEIVTSTWFIASAVCFAFFLLMYLIVSYIKYKKKIRERYY